MSNEKTPAAHIVMCFNTVSQHSYNKHDPVPAIPLKQKVLFHHENNRIWPINLQQINIFLSQSGNISSFIIRNGLSKIGNKKKSMLQSNDKSNCKVTKAK